MLKYWVMGALSAVALFAFTPAEKVAPSVESLTKFGSADDYQWYKKHGPTSGMTSSSSEKSGLRLAIEGRLKWLGLPHELWLPLPCLNTEDGGVICARLL
jgi:hypothetical protein